MRILHVDSGREMRGGQRQALFLMEGLREAGHECVLLSPKGSPLSANAHERGFDVRDLTVSAVTRNAAGIALIHAHDARAHTLALTACRLPLVVSRRVGFPAGGGAASRWKYSRPERFVAISNFVRASLMSASVRGEKISVVYDGVAVPAETARGEAIVAVATEDPRKGSGLAREAARLAGVEVRFSKMLEDDLPHARLFLYLSEQEGLGSAALLASAYGVPVIASAVGGLPEAVVHECTGLVTENRVEAVAACIKRLLSDPERAREIGKSGRERVEREFTISVMVRGTLAAYEKVLG